jgi:UDP-N-acetylmuramoylalanine--D-glutamate ligase
MTPVTIFAGKAVALFGLGGSGLATARALQVGGAEVHAWDDSEAGRTKAMDAGLHVTDLSTADWSRFAALILAPGVPLTHPAPHWSVVKAHAAGVEIIGDIELFFRERAKVAPGSTVVAITGTNGKSTTTALIAHVLKSAGRDVQMGGNIGTNILDLAPPALGRFHVIEMSSFQIDLAPSLHATVGIQLNLTPDHLDRHGTLAAYAAIKERLVASADTAVIGVDDALSRAMADRRSGTGLPLVRISVTSRLPTGVVARGARIARMEGGEEIDIATLDGIASLRGAHNAQNACAAAAALLALGLTSAQVQAGFASYTALAHRMEPVGQVGAVQFVNDSKATNAESVEGALKAFTHIFWIAGGKAKDGGIAPLKPFFASVAKAYLIGDAAAAFAQTLGKDVPHELCGTLERAVAAAARDAAQSGLVQPIVLLSPACASYDQYKSFEHRGAHFRTLVSALPGFMPAHSVPANVLAAGGKP